jgi:hypothetical protein
MEILLAVLAGWLMVSALVALGIGRLIAVADRRDRATVITSAGVPHSTRETASRIDDAEVHETA